MIILKIWSGLVSSAGHHLEWDEAFITSVVTSVATYKLSKYRAFQIFQSKWLNWGVWQI